MSFQIQSILILGTLYLLNKFQFGIKRKNYQKPHLPKKKYDYAKQFNVEILDASNNKSYCGYDAAGNRVRKIMINNNDLGIMRIGTSYED